MKLPQPEEILFSEIENSAALDKIKRIFSKKYRRPLLTNVELLKVYRRLAKKGSIKESKKLEALLRKRRVRSLSGIVSVSLLTKPYPCPGQCLYCPTQRKMPKSYLDNEPAVMRAIANDFDPFRQVTSRLQTLYGAGHPINKVELIIIGGTWSYLPKRYQSWFIKRCFEAGNAFHGKTISQTLEAAQKRNEKAKCRIIGITVETRPDFINEKEIINLRELGVTRVELGVQSIYDDVLALNKRGHAVKETIKATKLLKDAGFKVCYHLMPNLPGSTLKRDQQMFETIFADSSFQPDLLKIYPCVILKEAPRLHKMWQQGKYRPYTDKELIELLVNAKKHVPVYCRIQRLIRDIPSTEIIAGCKVSNLRQDIAKQLKKNRERCWCIRCREIKEAYDPDTKLRLFRQDYKASSGKEIFLSFEDSKRDNLYSLLRLRIPENNSHFIPALSGAALIREIHTYGQVIPVGKGSKTKKSPQHKGLGIKLLKEAERIAKKEFGLKKIAVISGIGARSYYSRKAGYKLEATYMVKAL